MTQPADPYVISSPEQLALLFGEVGEASIKKEVSFVHPHYRALIEASPSPSSPRAGPTAWTPRRAAIRPGFVVVQDEKTLLLPERRGNNRVDSLRNILFDPRVALLF